METQPPVVNSQTDSPAWEEFCQDYSRILQDNKRRIEQFLKLLSLFDRRGLSVIPLKGMDLLVRAYASAGMRPMNDIDLLVRREQLPEIRRALESEGLRRVPDEGLTYISADGALNLDMIWDFWYFTRPRGMAGIWERSCRREFSGRTVRCLHPEDALLYLIAYVVAHRGALCGVFANDISLLLKSESIDWQRWIRAVRTHKLEAACYHGLDFARKSGAEIPEAVLHELRPRNFTSRRLLEFYRRAVTEKGRPKVSYLHTWHAYQGWRGKCKLLREKLAPSPAEVEMHTGRTGILHYLAHLILHPFKILLNAGPRTA